MSEDRRGFVYRLEPLRLQARWKLDALLRELACAGEKLAGLCRQLQVLESHKSALVASSKPSSMTLFDPTLAHRRLAYLVDVVRRIDTLTREQAAAQALHADLQTQSRSAQLKLDGMDRDHDRCLKEHLAEQAQRNAVVADQDWLARAEWRRSQGSQVMSTRGGEGLS